MKSIFKKVLCCLLISAMFNIPTLAADNIIVEIDGQRVSFSDQQPVIVDGRTLVPIRGVFEKLGYTVNWSQQTKMATLTNGSNTVRIIIGEPTFFNNGKTHNLDVPAQIINGRTMLPFRAVLESVGCGVDWNANSRAVIVSTSDSVSNTQTILSNNFSSNSLTSNNSLKEGETFTYYENGVAMYRLTLKKSLYEQSEHTQFVTETGTKVLRVSYEIENMSYKRDISLLTSNFIGKNEGSYSVEPKSSFTGYTRAVYEWLSTDYPNRWGSTKDNNAWKSTKTETIRGNSANKCPVGSKSSGELLFLVGDAKTFEVRCKDNFYDGLKDGITWAFELSSYTSNYQSDNSQTQPTSSADTTPTTKNTTSGVWLLKDGYGEDVYFKFTENGEYIIHKMNGQYTTTYERGTYVINILMSTDKYAYLYFTPIEYYYINGNSVVLDKNRIMSPSSGMLRVDLENSSWVPDSSYKKVSEMPQKNWKGDVSTTSDSSTSLWEKRVNSKGSIAEGIFDNKGNLVEGKATDLDGGVQEGKFEDGWLVSGKAIYPDGSIAEGKFSKVTGSITEGKVTFPDGEIWDGKFENGYLTSGKIMCLDGTIVEGSFSNKMMSLVGKVICSNGEIQDGTFKNGGIISGKVKFPDGITHEGTFSEYTGCLVNGKVIINGISYTVTNGIVVNNSVGGSSSGGGGNSGKNNLIWVSTPNVGTGGGYWYDPFDAYPRHNPWGWK